MKSLLVRWTMLASLLTFAVPCLLTAEEEMPPGTSETAAAKPKKSLVPRHRKKRRRTDMDEVAPPTFRYKIQKRGADVGPFNGWFIGIDSKAVAEEGQVSNLVTYWNDKPTATSWEVRQAGEFNGVEAVYLIQEGDNAFKGWFLGIDPETHELTLYDSARPSSTKWQLKYTGNAERFDLYQIQNVGLTADAGSYVTMTPGEKPDTGAARNVTARKEPDDSPRTFWTLKHVEETNEEFQARHKY